MQFLKYHVKLLLHLVSTLQKLSFLEVTVFKSSKIWSKIYCKHELLEHRFRKRQIHVIETTKAETRHIVTDLVQKMCILNGFIRKSFQKAKKLEAVLVSNLWFAPICNLEEKSCTQKVRLIMFTYQLSGLNFQTAQILIFDFFPQIYSKLAIQCNWNSKISQNLRNLFFFENIDEFPQKLDFFKILKGG